MKKPTIALDFDGVLYSYKSNYGDGSLIDPPVEGAQEFCQWLHASNFDIVVFSCRFIGEWDSAMEQRNAARRWMSDNGFPKFMYADTRGEQGGRTRVVLTPVKPLASVYIDDRGFRFEGDFDVMKRFLQLPNTYAPWFKKVSTE